MFLSLLVARRLRGKAFALLAIIISGLIAFFSVGIPSYVTLTEYHRFPSSPKSGVLLENPFPLSFPICASLSWTVTFSSGWQDLGLYFAGLLFHAERILGVDHMAGYWLEFSLADYANFFSFFMLINVVGSVFGYWLSRRAFVDRLSKPVKRAVPAAVAIALAVASVNFLSSAYQFWSSYNWAMWTLQSPLPIGEGRTALSIQLISAVWNYVSLFPVYFFVGLAFGTFAAVTAIVTMHLRRKASFVAATAIVSSAFQFFEAYKIWETYILATHQVLGPLAYLTYFNYEATYVYQTLFWPYFLSGSVAVASGIILITLGRLKAKLATYWIKREQSRGIVV